MQHSLRRTNRIRPYVTAMVQPQAGTVTGFRKTAYPWDSDAERTATGYTLPSIVVEDLSMDTNESSLYSGQTSLGQHSLVTAVGTPQPTWNSKPAIRGSSALFWLDEKTLAASPPFVHKEFRREESFLSTSLDQYPKSPPLGYLQSASVNSFGSSIEALRSLASPTSVATPNILPDSLRRGGADESGVHELSPQPSGSSTIRKPGPRNSYFKPESASVDRRASIPASRKLRKRGRRPNLRDLYTQNSTKAEHDNDMPMTTDPAYSFEYQLTLAILDAMERVPIRHTRKRGVSQKPKHFTTAFAQGLGDLRQRLGSRKVLGLLMH